MKFSAATVLLAAGAALAAPAPAPAPAKFPQGGNTFKTDAFDAMKLKPRTFPLFNLFGNYPTGGGNNGGNYPTNGGNNGGGNYPALPVPNLPVPNLPVPNVPAPNVPVPRPNLPIPNLPLPNLPAPVTPKPGNSGPGPVKPRPSNGGNYGTGSCRRCSPGNPIGGIIDQLYIGVDVEVALYALLGSKDLAKFILEASLDVELMVKLDAILGNADFLARLDVLLSSDVFLSSCSGAALQANISLQLGVLLSNTGFMKQCTGYLSSASFLNRFLAQISADVNLGVKLSAWLGNTNFINLLVSILGQGTLGANVSLLLKDVTVMTQIRALLVLQANFGAGLGSLLADVNFTAHVCGVLGITADLTAKIQALFVAKVGFAAQLEAILGVAFQGKFTAFLGVGTHIDILVNFFGAGSFHDACSNYFGGGAFIKTCAGLFIDVQFAAKFSAFISAWISAKVDAVSLCGSIFADVSFTTKISGLLKISAQVAVKVSGVLGGSGFSKVCNGFKSGPVPSRGFPGGFGGLGGLFKGLLGGHRLL